MRSDADPDEADRSQAAPVAGPVALRPAYSWRAMAYVGIAMLLQDKLKFAGILVGVIVAVVLSNQQTATFLGLLGKNTMLARHAGADIWIAPPRTEILQAGGTIPDSVLWTARSTPGVAWAAPILMGGGNLNLPTGGSQPVTIIGVELPAGRGGPWNVVGGDVRRLSQPDAMVFEDSEREHLGGLNLGSVRELNGHRVQAVAFTSGLLPFGPSYAFTSFDTAREIMHVENHRVSYVLVGVRPGVEPEAVADGLRQRLQSERVMTRAQVERSTFKYLVTRTPIGLTMGTSALFGVLVGFIVVSLTLFSAVVDRTREFGTLKAIGATNRDLARLLVTQAVTVALVGWLIGQTLVIFIIQGIRSPRLPLGLPLWMVPLTLGAMVLLCVGASTLALLRVRKVEPGMVFRG